MNNRFNEWYAPKHGPVWLRSIIGMTFYPYTLMVSSFVFVGSAFANRIIITRSIILFIAYVICLGISAHSFDSLGSKNGGPWGNYINKKILTVLAFSSLFSGLYIASYYAFYVNKFLIIVGIIEVFFIFSYNLELFHGMFHNNIWLGFATGSMPVIAGYMVQNGNSILIIALLFILGYSIVQIEIQASRPYRLLKRNEYINSRIIAAYYEKILKSIVIFPVTITAIIIIMHIW